MFQGRYKAILVDKDSYLLALIRYIHLNPVNAKLVKTPSRYRWSSHPCYLGKALLPWLDTEWVLSQFGKRVSTSRKHYTEFIQSDSGKSYSEDLKDNRQDSRVLGDDKFLEKVLGKTEPNIHKELSLDQLITIACADYKIDNKDLFSVSRNRQLSELRQVIGWLALKSGLFTLTEVADCFGRDLTTLSRGVRRLDDKAKADKKLARKLSRLYNTSLTPASLPVSVKQVGWERLQ